MKQQLKISFPAKHTISSVLFSFRLQLRVQAPLRCAREESPRIWLRNTHFRIILKRKSREKTFDTDADADTEKGSVPNLPGTETSGRN